MPSLTDLVHVIPPDKEDDAEDIFAAASYSLFKDVRNLHGDPDSVVVYQSQRFGPIELRTADPEGEIERRLFSHYVWNASIKLSELISVSGSEWDVAGDRVLELGAGAGLSGIVATLVGAREVVISDYPADVVLSNIRRNAQKAIPSQLDSIWNVQGHEWGVFDEAAAQQEHTFTRILAADCFWMPSEHLNLVRSMLHFLSLDPDSRVFAIAGFHTGRAKLAAFFTCAIDEGLDVDEIYEEDDEGCRREWASERDGGREDHTLRKKWLVVARLKRRDAPSSYKLLAASVRNLRNALEEIEEDYDPTRSLGPDDVKLINQIGRSHDILSRVDLALQACDGAGQEDVNMNAISDLKTGLDVSTHQLKLAFEATTTGEIPLKLDTGDFPTHPRAAASIEDSSASRSREGSVWSLANRDGPRSPGASDATSVHTDRIDRSSSEEKQLLSPSMSMASDARASMDFRSPFADPLSMGIDEATSFILGGDDDLSMSAYARPRSRSRAGSDISAATETFVSAPGSPKTEDRPHSHSIDAAATERSGLRIDEATEHSPSPTDDPARKGVSRGAGEGESSSTILHNLSVSPADSASKRESTGSQTSLHRSLEKQDSQVSAGAAAVSECDPSTASGEIASGDGSSRPSSREPAILDKPLPQSPQAAGTQSKDSQSGSITGAITSAAVADGDSARPLSISETAQSRQSDPDLQGFVRDLNETIETAFASGQSDYGHPDQIAKESRPVNAEASPPPPQRKPPAPPPPPVSRRARPNVLLSSANSKYRIVNDGPEELSSEDEDDFYSSSRPTSYVKAASQSPALSPPPVTPTIRIDQSALDDAERSLGSDVRVASGPETAANAACTSQEELGKPPLSQSPPPSQPSLPPRPTQSPPLPPSVQKRIDAAVAAGDKLLAREIEEKHKHKMQPPPVPPRPQSRYHRPRAATTTSTPATLAEKEIAVAESGLEPAERMLTTTPSDPRLVPRISVDHALNVAGQDRSSAPEPLSSLEGTRHGRSASTSQLPRPQIPLGYAQSRPSFAAGERPLSGWYGPGADPTPQSELVDHERIDHICHFWNTMSWNSVEQYLMAYLESLIEQDNLPMARRVRHLLAVCASFKGDFSGAITMFLSVLEISSPADLSKPGNCEACYWLGDLYAMQNQRLEALLAYLIAQWGDVFRDPAEPNLRELIKAEQEAVQFGMPKSEFQRQWTQEAMPGCGTLLDPAVLPGPVVKYLFEVEPRRDFPPEKQFRLDANQPRASAFFSLSHSPQIAKFRRNKINPDFFFSDGPWPLQYDPTFVMENVKRERILGQVSDLLVALSGKDGESKLPKIGPMSISRMDCFTCSDVSWLVATIRDCLRMLEMEWSEVANDQGAWFIVRHTLLDGPGSGRNSSMKMATVHYFAMSLFRTSFRSSYGVQICSHGVSSARIMEPANLDYERGVHHSEAKRITKLITETLEEAEKRRPKAKKRQSSIGLGIYRSNSSDDQPVKV